MPSALVLKNNPENPKAKGESLELLYDSRLLELKWKAHIFLGIQSHLCALIQKTCWILGGPFEAHFEMQIGARWIVRYFH